MAVSWWQRWIGRPSQVLRAPCCPSQPATARGSLARVDLPAKPSLFAGGFPRSTAPRPGCLPLAARCHGRTERGRLRKANEDQFLITALLDSLPPGISLPLERMRPHPSQGHLFAVADGVCGRSGGELASALAVYLVETFLRETLRRGSFPCPGGKGVLAKLQEAITWADERIFTEGQRRWEVRGMGTTLTLALILDNELFLAHAGDTRCYLLHGGVLSQLTHDHTLVAQMVRHGLLRPEEAARHEFRHALGNVVGGGERGVYVETLRLPLEAGDRLLLCSDGLTELVPDGEILDVLQEAEDPVIACQRLVDQAQEEGGRDDATVVVAFFGE